MSLQFIFGNSGSGKSYTLYQKIIEESRQNPEGNYIVIVPEQFTMQTQKDLVQLHPDGGILNLDVLSFRRLAHRIFEEVGADRRSVLTETGKNLMLRKVANQEREKLKVLGSRMNRTGYVSEVKSVLSELMQYEVSDFELEQLERFAGKRPLLQAKLSDLRCLYRAFLEYRQDRFLKPEELLDVFCQVAGQSQLLKRSVLAFDGFAGFTPSQIRVLEELMVFCPKLYVTVTIDARESAFGAVNGHELFDPSRKLVRSVCEAARRGARRRGGTYPADGHPEGKGMADGRFDGKAAADGYSEGKGLADLEFLESPMILGRKKLPRFRADGALYHLEQNLFRKRRHPFFGDLSELSAHVSPTPADEVHFAARTISHLVRREGLRYREIAVITGDLASYDNYVKKYFPQYGIPAFIDETRHILLNPCLEFVRGVLEMTARDFSCESVFRCLRTGMAGLPAEAADRLENYVLAAGIRGRSMWEKEWTYLPPRMEPEELERCNALRVQVVETFGAFSERMRQKNLALREYADGLYELLAECGLQQKLQEREAQLLAQGQRELAKEYGQIYGILMNLLDEMTDLLGEERMGLQEFTEILDAGLAEAKVGVIPPGIDQVQVGDIRRTRLAHVKVLFFLGLNDGWVPAHGDGGGIVSEMERELLKETGIELAPSARENSYIQRFYLYQNLTKPSQHLYLSWCLGSCDGAEMRPSYLVSVIRRLFPQLAVTQEKEAGTELSQITSKENGLLYLTYGLQELREGRELPAWKELYALYQSDPQYQKRTERLLRAAFAKELPEQLSYHVSRELYGEVMTNSVTRLEQFAACSFAHFAAYGLRLHERELYGVRPADLGILFHRSLELFSRRIAGDGRDWTELQEQEQNVLMERCVDEVTQEYGASVLHSSARAEYTILRLKRILCRSAWALHEQLAAGSFRPVGFEVSFDDASELEAVNVRFGGNGRMRLQGRIDRIDTAQEDGEIYVKVVDYKSGMAQFDPVSLYYGLQLQLVVYLNAALEMERRQHPDQEVIPAGIFYYHIQDPVLDKEEAEDPEKAREKLLKKLRPDGIVNEDVGILRKLDRKLEGDSLVIPAGLKKDGTLRAASSAVTTEQFGQLSQFVRRKMAEMGERMLSGEIAASPSVTGGRSACEYCQYLEVCGFDRRLPGMCERRLPELDKDEVWEKIAQECGKEEQER